jgi:hypothetical protein
VLTLLSSKRNPGRRSSNPTRKLFTLLSKVNSLIKICQPGNTVVQPQHVTDLRKSLIRDTGVRVILRVLEVREKKYPNTIYSKLTDEGISTKS